MADEKSQVDYEADGYCFDDVNGNNDDQRVTSKEGRGSLMSSPLSGISGLSFDSTLLSPLLFFCLVLLLFLSYTFFFLLANFPENFPENSSNIFH